MATNSDKVLPTEDSDAVAARQKRIANYNRAVRVAEIVTIALSELKFKVSQENAPEPEEGKKLKPSYNGRLNNIAFDAEKGLLIVSVEWIVEIKAGRKVFSKCSAVYDVFYKGMQGFDEDTIDLYAENVARPTSYSYFRALYASLDWSAGIASPPLPIIKLHPRVP